ncbi:P-loop containing nucleoside triphosphate hydrolase protein [Peziza echinospora]|nr:P-loop containing nucleoside triphosphate hydrolase protein [Peziza echinospora]
MTEEIEEKLKGKGLELNIDIKIIDWQVDACVAIMQKRDVIVNVPTGGGKTICYRSFCYMRTETVLVVSPLVSLMNDLVGSDAKWGIDSCCLSADSCRNRPELLDEIMAGVYQIVYMCPEYICGTNTGFMRLMGLRKKPSVFAKRLGLIVVDESVLINIHRDEFRPKYANISLLRTFLPKLPVLAMSATLPDHILAYVHTSLDLAKPCGLIRVSVDRPNIFLSAKVIKQTKATFTDLDFLIPKPAELQAPSDIFKTIIFVDSGPDRTYPDMIVDYSTVLSSERRNQVISEFKIASGGVRILVVTEAAAMGVDIPDVRRVIQWGLYSWVTLLTLWQRLGRGARNPFLRAGGIIFYTKPLIITPDDRNTVLKLLSSMNPTADQQADILDLVVACDMGIVKKQYRTLTAEQNSSGMVQPANPLGRYISTEVMLLDGINLT